MLAAGDPSKSGIGPVRFRADVLPGGVECRRVSLADEAPGTDCVREQIASDDSAEHDRPERYEGTQ
jgi:hypothetical protein